MVPIILNSNLSFDQMSGHNNIENDRWTAKPKVVCSNPDTTTLLLLGTRHYYSVKTVM